MTSLDGLLTGSGQKITDLWSSYNRFRSKAKSASIWNRQRHGIRREHETLQGMYSRKLQSFPVARKNVLTSVRGHRSDRLRWSAYQRFTRRQRSPMDIAQLARRPGWSSRCSSHRGQYRVPQILHGVRHSAPACAADSAPA